MAKTLAPSTTIDLNLVATFARVVEVGSFTRAAATLRLPTSSVSRRVARLEDQLGSRLLHRTTRALTLTEAGRAYHEQATIALRGLDAAATALADLRREPSGVVRVAAAPDISLALLPAILARFHRRYPKIHAELSLSARSVDLVADGFDLAVRASRFEDSSLVVRRIATPPRLGLFASRSYLRSRGTPRAVADLARHDVILFRARAGRDTWKLAAADGTEERVDVRGPVGVDDLGFVSAAIRAGLGIGLCPQARYATDGLVRVLPAYGVGPPDVSLGVVMTSARLVPARVVLLRDHLVAELGRALGQD